MLLIAASMWSGFEEMQRMWPAPNSGTPNAEWVEKGGYYVLHTDNPVTQCFHARKRAR